MANKPCLSRPRALGAFLCLAALLPGCAVVAVTATAVSITASAVGMTVDALRDAAPRDDASGVEIR